LSLLTADAALLSVTISVHAVDKKKPNILVIWGDDIGTWNISHNNRGMMDYRTPNIDRIAREGVASTAYYAQQSCTGGRSAFLSGSVSVRKGMTKVGLPGAKEGWQKVDVTMATVLESQGYSTGQFGKNHQGDRDEHLPAMHGFDEFLGSLYHLNANEEPENEDYPKAPAFLKNFGPRGVLISGPRRA
jgi:arylsulfatase